MLSRSLVKHEIGIVAMSRSGTVRWKFDGDIITKATVRGERLYLEVFDAPPVTLNLSDGRRVE